MRDITYIIGIIIVVVAICLLWEFLKKVIEYLIGLAFIAAIVLAAIMWGPAIIMGLFSLIVLIFPYLLYIIGGIITLGLLYIIITKLKDLFVKYPWQFTIILIVLVIAVTIVCII